MNVPLKSLEQQFDELVDQMAPPPPADAPAAATVLQSLMNAATGTQTALQSGLQQLGQLSWDDRFLLLEELARNESMDENRSYLEIIEGVTRTLPDVDSAVHAAMIVVLMNGLGRTLSTVDITLYLANALVTLNERDQYQLLRRLGINELAAEGTIASLTAAAIAASVIPLPEALSTIFQTASAGVAIGKWNPGNLPPAFYVGLEAHVAIAQFYKAANTGDFVETNTTPIGSILLQLQALMVFKGNRIAHALAISRPDIFHWSLLHPQGAPGWIYEIKPWSSAATAELEALFYADALNLTGIPTTPGPIGTPGTAGCVPAPGGWYVFSAVAPGAIVYWYRKATKEEAKARGTEPAPSETEDKAAAALKAAGATAATAPLVVVILDALVEGGWVLVL